MKIFVFSGKNMRKYKFEASFCFILSYVQSSADGSAERAACND